MKPHKAQRKLKTLQHACMIDQRPKKHRKVEGVLNVTHQLPNGMDIREKRQEDSFCELMTSPLRLAATRDQTVHGEAEIGIR